MKCNKEFLLSFSASLRCIEVIGTVLAQLMLRLREVPIMLEVLVLRLEMMRIQLRQTMVEFCYLIEMIG